MASSSYTLAGWTIIVVVFSIAAHSHKAPDDNAPAQGNSALQQTTNTLAAAAAASSASSSKPDLQALATQYFEVWNKHDTSALEGMFTTDGSLRDWDISVSGSSNVAKANGDIFKALPKVKIQVTKLHVGAESVAAEIEVQTNNDKSEVLKVVDVMEFDTEGKIRSLRAYKG